MRWLDQLQTFMPHGMCLLWRPELMVLHIGSDALIALAYFAIPFGIAQFVVGRTDLETKHRWLAYLFASFIGLCGVTHVASILVLWYPYYVTEGWLKAITAAASAATAIYALSLVPTLLRLPSAKTLQDEIDSHRKTLIELNAARAALETRVNLTEHELKQSERNLVASDKLLRTVIETVPGAIYAKDQVGRMLLANRATLSIIGKPWNLIEGKTDDDFIPDKNQASAIMANDKLVMDHGTVQEMEEFVRIASGEIRTFLSTKTPLINARGETSGIVGVSIDVTDRKRADEEARNNIQDALREKTRAVEQRDILIREVYHRVKNNLQIIDSFLVIQGRLLTDIEAKRALNSLRDRVFALGLVHHQLMASADLSTFSIAPFLQELTNNLIDGASSTDVKLSIYVEAIATGLDFAIPFGLIVTELVTNAIKHAFPEDSGNITVIVKQNEYNRILLIVRDDGSGYPSKDLTHSAAQKGLGNSIVSSMVRQLQGTIVTRFEAGTIVEVNVEGPIVK